MSQTAIVILNYNGEKLLQQFLPAVLLYADNALVVVADNASTDQSVPLLNREFPQVRLIALDQNYGFCGGYNRALSQLTADYFVLLNSDVEVTPNWLPPLIQLLDNNHRIAAVQPKICAYNHKRRFEHAGAGGGFIDALGYPFCRGRVFDHIEADRGQYDDVRPVFWSSGACMAIRSEAFFRFGGFDEDFFAHMEEIDLCWKIHRTGQSVFYCGQSVVYHVGAGTLDYGNPRKILLNFRNGLSLIFKHLNAGELAYKLPLRLLLDWIAAFRFTVMGQFSLGIAVLSAHLQFFKSLKKDIRKRKEIQVLPDYDRSNIKQGLILVDFYLQGKKQFKG